MAIYHAPCRKGSFASSDSASLFIHQLVILRGHCFIISRLLFFFSHITNHALILTMLTMIPPGLALLLGSCLGEQSELFLRTGASFLTLKSSILPGEIAFTLPSQQNKTYITHLLRTRQHIRLFLSLVPQQRRVAPVSIQDPVAQLDSIGECSDKSAQTATRRAWASQRQEDSVWRSSRGTR